MDVTALDGREIRVRRRWLPWRVKPRDIAGDTPLDTMDFTDGIEGLIFGIILVIIFVLFGTFIFFGFELVFVLVLLVPLLALMRVFWVLPWVIEAQHDHVALGSEKVRGWRDSEDRIRDIATAYQRGEDPFAQGSTGGLDFTGTK
jgi:hypothetical protein